MVARIILVSFIRSCLMEAIIRSFSILRALMDEFPMSCSSAMAHTSTQGHGKAERIISNVSSGSYPMEQDTKVFLISMAQPMEAIRLHLYTMMEAPFTE